MASSTDFFSFPEYMALLDKAGSPHVFALKAVVRPDWSWDHDLPENGLSAGFKAVSFRTQADVCAAHLVAFPWVRVREGSALQRGQLLSCSLELKFDGVKVVSGAPLKDFFDTEDGTFSGLPPKAIEVTREMNVYPGLTLSQKGADFFADRQIGAFLANDTLVELEITPPPGLKTSPMRLSAGLFAMGYTTRVEARQGVETSKGKVLLADEVLKRYL